MCKHLGKCRTLQENHFDRRQCSAKYYITTDKVSKYSEEQYKRWENAVKCAR